MAWQGLTGHEIDMRCMVLGLGEGDLWVVALLIDG